MRMNSSTGALGPTRTSTDISFCDETRVPMFYFDSKTTRLIVLLQCVALAFLESLY